MKKKGTPPGPAPPSPRGVRTLFAAWVLVLALASYFPLPADLRTLLGLLALGGSLAFLLLRTRGGRGTSSLLDDPPPIFWGALVLLLLLTRFYHFTTLPFWPIGDEGILSSLALEQTKDWRWDLLVAQDRQEALGVWCLAWFFRIFEPSLFSIRLFPALLSLATCAAAYWAARQFFPKGFSFLFLTFFGLCFWEFTFSRFCMRIVLLTLVQCFCIGALGLCWRKGTRRGWAPLCLGILGGLGFYTFTSWAGVWLALAACLIISGPLQKRRGLLAVFILASALVASPMALARLAPGGMSYIQSNFDGGSPGGLLLDYLRQIFWDGTKSFPFGSNWGGLFNPLFGALVLLGAWSQWRLRSGRTRLAFGLFLLLTALPALLANGIELHRLAAWFPLLTLLAAFGASALGAAPSRALPLLGALGWAAASGFLDSYNFAFRYSNPELSPPGQQWRSLENHQAYGILKDLCAKEGPVLLFSEFNTDYDNKTLNVAAYPFDGLQDPRISGQCATAALLVHQDYGPFLEKEFPGTRTQPLTGDPRDRPRSLMLALLPLSSFPPGRLEEWKRVDTLHRRVHGSMRDKTPSEAWGKFAQPLLLLEGQGSKDPFLTSFHWEKLAFFRVLDGDFKDAASFYERTLREGIASPHLGRNLARARELAGKTEGR